MWLVHRASTAYVMEITTSTLVLTDFELFDDTNLKFKAALDTVISYLFLYNKDFNSSEDGANSRRKLQPYKTNVIVVIFG